MNELKKLTTEYFEIKSKCDGTAETFAELYPVVKCLLSRVNNLMIKSRSREVRYFALKLCQDLEEMETRFWKYTINFDD